PSASLAARARATRSGSEGGGSSPEHSTPRSDSRSVPAPRASSGRGAAWEDVVGALTSMMLPHARRRPRQSQGVHVLVAHDSFSGTLAATQAAEAMATGWRRSAPDDLLSLAPLSDGGPGFLDVLTTGVVGESVVVTTTGPRGTPVPGALLIT